MKKILAILGRVGTTYGGAELHMLELCSFLKLKYEIRVAAEFVQDEYRHVFSSLVFRRLKITSFFYFLRQKLKFRGFGRLGMWVDACYKFFQLIKYSKGSDAIMTPYYSYDNSLVLAAVWLSKLIKKPLILRLFAHFSTFGSDEFKRRSKAFWESSFLKYIYKNSNFIIVCTQAEKKWLSQFVLPSKLAIVGVSPYLVESGQRISVRKKLNIEKEMVLFIGRKQLYKGFGVLLEAAQLVWKSFDRCCFVFIGADTVDSHCLFENVCDTRIINLGLVSQEDKLAALSECDIFCMPSQAESFGIVFLEAWAFKKPVIAAELEPLRDIIKHRENGFLIQPDAVSVANAIIELLKDSGLRNRLGENGYRLFHEEYSSDVISRKYFALFDEWLNKEK